VVEGAFGCSDVVEQILDAELLVAARLDQTLAGVDEFVASSGVLMRVDRPWCRCNSASSAAAV